MKTFIGAIALVIAAPVAAQGAAAPEPHAEHEHHHGRGQQHQGASEHQSHEKHQGHDEHKMDCCSDCCDKGEQQSGEGMKCCAKHGGEAPEHDHSDHGQ